jgi:hypothetical protein
MSKPLSPAAQFILNAAIAASSCGAKDVLSDARSIAAAALRAATYHGEYFVDPEDGKIAVVWASDLEAWATQLEAPMLERLPDIPAGSTIRQNPDGSWQYRRRSVGPWIPMPAPQSGLPWPAPPAIEQSPATQLTPADRLALAVCSVKDRETGPCPVEAICSDCRQGSAAVAHELAGILRERHGGSSQVADWLDGVGCHPGTVQTVQQDL